MASTFGSLAKQLDSAINNSRVKCASRQDDDADVMHATLLVSCDIEMCDMISLPLPGSRWLGRLGSDLIIVSCHSQTILSKSLHKLERKSHWRVGCQHDVDIFGVSICDQKWLQQ